MFGRATIRLGIGPQSSYQCILSSYQARHVFTARCYVSAVCYGPVSVCAPVTSRSFFFKTAKDVVSAIAELLFS